MLLSYQLATLPRHSVNATCSFKVATSSDTVILGSLPSGIKLN